MLTLNQLEDMKGKLVAERKQSDSLREELKEKNEREQALLRKLERRSNTPPIIVFASPTNNSRVEFHLVSLSGVVADDNGVKKIELFLNDKLIDKEGDRGFTVTEQKYPKRIEFIERISLEKGLNSIKLRAVDLDGVISEKILTIEYIDRRRNLWAVIIGIDKYQNFRQLKYAVNDAKAFYNYMTKNNWIPPENVTLLLDEDASLKNIKSTLGTTLKKKAGKDDQVIIFFAGHGATEEDSFSPDGDGLEKYLLPFDADLNDLYSSALPVGELSIIFNRIQSDRLIYIADACYSGASGGRTIGVSGKRANISGRFMDRIAKGKGRVIITASGANEVSKEDDKLKHGVFTYYLIDGLKGKADTNKDGSITVDEAYNYVYLTVPRATSQTQHPVKKGSVEGQLILGIIE